MTKIPLILRVKKQIHKEIVDAQDSVVKAMYEAFPEAVLHGGTAIWRCYEGNRFSEDIDVYILKDQTKITALFASLKKEGFVIMKKKVTANSIFSTLEFNGAVVRFEALFKKVRGVLKEYETSDGNYITIYTLNPEELIIEKTEAYLKRFKIKDLYDIFFLLRHVRDMNEVSKVLKKLVRSFKKPNDEKELRVLIIEGIVPNTEDML